MITSNYTVTILQPSDGYTLTQMADVDVKDRILSKKVYLASTDKPENWKEITDEEAESIRLQREELEKAKSEPDSNE